MDQSLKGRRLAALVADGFEKVELVVPMKALQAAGAEVDVISLRHGSIRGVNLHEPASRVRVDKTIAEANPDDYEPGPWRAREIAPPYHGRRGAGPLMMPQSPRLRTEDR